MRPRTRFIFWTVLLGAVFVGELLWLWSVRGPRILNLPLLLDGGVVIMIPLAAVAVLLLTTPPNAIRLSVRTSLSIILGGGVVLQAAAVAWIVPAVGSDLARYRLDGGMWVSRISPYSHTLNDAVRDFETGGRFAPDKIDADVTAPNRTTRYLPVAEATFALGRVLELTFCPPLCVNLTHEQPSSNPWHDHVLQRPWVEQAPTFRILFAVMALATTAALALLLARSGHSVWWAAIFGWCPFVVLGAGGIGRHEFTALFLGVLAILAVRRGKTVFSIVWIALATGASPLAVLLIPWLWHRQRRETHGQQASIAPVSSAG